MSPVGIAAFGRGKRPAGGSGGTFTINPSFHSGSINSFYTFSGTYASVRDGTATINAFESSNLNVGQYFAAEDPDPESGSPESMGCQEGFLDFDVSAVTGTLSSATLSLGLFDNRSVTDFVVEARTHDWGTTLTTADWVAGASIAGKTLLATLATSGLGAFTYYAFTESGTALRDAVTAAKAGSGILRIFLVSDRQRNNIQPSGEEYVNFEEYDHPTLKPKLVITTT